MNFKFINPHNVAWLVPPWAVDPFTLACAMDSLLERYLAICKQPWRWDICVKFWIDYSHSEELIRVVEPTEIENHVSSFTVRGPEWSLKLPLNPMLKGAPTARGTYSVYLHSFDLDCPLAYVGITKRRWFDRLAQHQTSARTGSPYLFHRALRQHANIRRFYQVVLESVDHDWARRFEEEMVRNMTLYPLGLNMIPGGQAGLAYLCTLGISANKAEDRDDTIERLANRPSLAGGHPNPLCAARWESDQDYVNRVICGHSGRLTIEQVRQIKLLSSFGHDLRSISSTTAIDVKRASAVIRGRTYGRVM